MKVCYFVVKDNELVEIDSKKVAATVMAAAALTTTPTAHAATVPAVDVKSLTQPFVQVIVDLSSPFSYACSVKGALKMAAGDEAKGKKMIKNALSGYLVVKFIPQIFEILDGVNLF